MTERNNPGQSRPIEILLVDDDDDDVQLTKKSLAKDRVINRIHRVSNGKEAMEFLRNEGEFKDATKPDLILLDLNMPKMDGRQVLKELKNDPKLKAIPVVVLTTSDDDKDVAASYSYKANSYVTKPVNLEQFREVVDAIREFWFTVVEFPQVD